MTRAPDTGVLYCDDNLARLARMPAESVDLVYLDPPFFSNRVYEVIWGDEAEVRSFEDRWDGGIQHYVDWMRQRVEELHRVLKPTGSLYLHCDPHASHYLKVMLDQVFGARHFRNEIVWKRTGSHNSAKRWGPVHDVLLFYARGDSYTWNVEYQEYDPTYLAEAFTYEDERGNFQPVSLTGPGRRQGESGQPWRNIDPTAVGRHWQPPTMLYDFYQRLTGESLAALPLHERLDRADDAGLIYWPKKKGGTPRFKQYAHISPGQPVQDVIQDIRALSSKARERLGYPTQKPEALLERVILASSDPDDVVLDPFCGCGTTVAVAERLGRRWIGVDISPTAMEVMRRRLRKENPALQLRIEGLPDSVIKLKQLKPFEFQNWVIAQINGKHSPRKVHDMGIDGYTFMTGDPVQVKQSEKVGRNVVDNFETAMRRAEADTGYIIAFSFTKNAREEVARAKWNEGLYVHLVKVEALLQAPDRQPLADIMPQPADVVELPLPSVPRREDRPSADELVASDRQAESA